jgi:hypothetical protein
LTTALNVYATTLPLGGTAGQTFGFQVTTAGLGAATYNVGTNGAAFGVATNTTLSVTRMLAAVNSQAVNGVLYNGNTALLEMARKQLDVVNVEGHVGIQDDQTKTIGFWHTSNTGQALILSFNGGPTSTALANWLAASFPNIYGASAGSHNLTGQTNTQVAAFFQTLWAEHHDEPDAQVMATALNVYATTTSLGGTAGQAYGFQATADGLGADSFNVGNDGAAVGVANNTTLNVYDILITINQRAVNGVLYNGTAALRDLCEDMCERLNRAGN